MLKKIVYVAACEDLLNLSDCGFNRVNISATKVTCFLSLPTDIDYTPAPRHTCMYVQPPSTMYVKNVCRENITCYRVAAACEDIY